jgi:hypothetical protein
MPVWWTSGNYSQYWPCNALPGQHGANLSEAQDRSMIVAHPGYLYSNHFIGNTYQEETGTWKIDCGAFGMDGWKSSENAPLCQDWRKKLQRICHHPNPANQTISLLSDGRVPMEIFPSPVLEAFSWWVSQSVNSTIQIAVLPEGVYVVTFTSSSYKQKLW